MACGLAWRAGDKGDLGGGVLITRPGFSMRLARGIVPLR